MHFRVLVCVYVWVSGHGVGRGDQLPIWRPRMKKSSWDLLSVGAFRLPS